MQEVTIDKLKLLEIMKKNREAHISEYNEAVEKYRVASVAELKRMLKKAQKGGEIEHILSTQTPRSYEENYNSVIAMLELHEEVTVILSYHEFQQYVEDKWNWRQQFDMVSSTYGVAGSKGPRGSVGLSASLGDFK